MADGQICTCHAAGRLRVKGESGRSGLVLPGDMVRVESAGGERLITEVEPRRTAMLRPAVANIDTCILVQSCVAPAPTPALMEKILIMAAWRGIPAFLCWTKYDMAPAAAEDPLVLSYGRAGYEYCLTSVVTGCGLAALQERLAGRVSILAGPSGVGKSSLLNTVCAGAAQATGAVSARIARGSHTTRHTELLPVPGGGWVADSPGFSALELDLTDTVNLGRCFPDFAAVTARCRFADCLHRNEPGCAVKQAVEAGEIDAARYHRYLGFLEEVELHVAQRF